MTTTNAGISSWAAPDPLFEGSNPAERRSRFKHDEDEIVYSKSFRRLSGKSQIVVKPESQDHFRSRLTHTIEVNHIAASIAQQLGLRMPLVNSISLGHDLGHSPFGHAGERELQDIMRNDILPLTDIKEVKKSLGIAYGFEDTSIDLEKPEYGYFLFHHATNSVSLIKRKQLSIDDLVCRGIMTHSWAPWQANPKFGIPLSYEAQAVAVADQVASINHDTEDILNCGESEHDLTLFRKECPQYLAEAGIMEYADAEKYLDEWFFYRDDQIDCNRSNSYSRRRRLQKIINSIADASKDKLLQNHIDDYKKSVDPQLSLCIDQQIGKFLQGCESYIRNIIKKVAWFGMRDAVAAGVVRTVYMYYKHYGLNYRPDTADNFPKNVAGIHEFWQSIKDDAWSHDMHYRAFVEHGLPGKSDQLVWSLKALTYVSGMTDGKIMDMYSTASKVFK